MSDWVTVAAEGDISPGKCRIVDIDDVLIAVYNINGLHYAIEDQCTHDGGELASGPVDGDQVMCPRHGATFCIKTGKALTAPAYEDIYCFPVRIEEGQVQVRDDRWD